MKFSPACVSALLAPILVTASANQATYFLKPGEAKCGKNIEVSEKACLAAANVFLIPQQNTLRISEFPSDTFPCGCSISLNVYYKDPDLGNCQANPSAAINVCMQSDPTLSPSAGPTSSSKPSAVPSSLPSAVPSAGPSSIPSVMPSQSPRDVPSSTPSLDPSSKPSAVPSSLPSDGPSAGPSSSPSVKPSQSPSDVPSSTPSQDPSSKPSTVPSFKPSFEPSAVPTSGCSNDLDFKFEGDSSRTCDSYVAFKPIKRCKKKQPGTGKKVKYFCPGTCKKKCKTPRGKCENLKTFRFQGNMNACDSYVAVKPVKRCRKDVEGKKNKVTGKLKKVKFFCPATCKQLCETF